jgi:hypothetical protein
MLSATSSTPWYGTAGAAFLVAVIVAVLTAVGLIFGYVSLRKARIRRRITCAINSNTRLPSSTQGLEISYQGKQLRNPYLARLVITNDGAEIPSELFSEDEDGNRRSIEFDLGVFIYDDLPLEHKPTAAPQPKISVSGSKFELEPELIASKESIMASFLTAGPVEKITLSQNPFGNVKFDIRDSEFRQRRSKKWRIILLSILAVPVALVVLSVIVSIPYAADEALNSVKKVGSGIENYTTTNACVSAAQSLHSEYLALELAFRDVEVDRNNKGRLTALHFRDTYLADLKGAAPDAKMFAEKYGQAAELDADLLGKITPYIRSLSNVPQGIVNVYVSFAELPKDNLAKANLDLEIITNTLKSFSYLSQSRFCYSYSR